MTKQLKRLNIKPIYSTRPISNSGHRHIHVIKRKGQKFLYMVTLSRLKYKSRTFKSITNSLCYKFIIILKSKANLRH